MLMGPGQVMYLLLEYIKQAEMSGRHFRYFCKGEPGRPMRFTTAAD